MEPGSPLRCRLVTLALPPDAASGRAREKLGVEEGGRLFLETLPFLSPHPWKDLFLPCFLPYLLLF